MKPEERARQKIDQLLQDAGWVIQDHKDLNLGSALGVAVREFPVSTGYADYLLFVDRQLLVCIEDQSPKGTTFDPGPSIIPTSTSISLPFGGIRSTPARKGRS